MTYRLSDFEEHINTKKVNPIKTVKAIVLAGLIGLVSIVGSREIYLEHKINKLEKQRGELFSHLANKAYLEAYGIPRWMGELHMGGPFGESYSIPQNVPQEILDISGELSKKYDSLRKEYMNHDDRIEDFNREIEKYKNRRFFKS